MEALPLCQTPLILWKNQGTYDIDVSYLVLPVKLLLNT